MRRLILGVALLAIIAGAAALGLAAGGHATSAPAAAPVHLYWANGKTTIGRARLDGTGVEQSFVSGTGRGPCGVALDREHIYWGEALGGKVGSPDEGGAVGTYAGPYGLGRQLALAGRVVRPFRRLVSAQAIQRREVFE